MGTSMILNREKELVELASTGLRQIKGLRILVAAENITERLGIFSFYVDNIHHNLVNSNY